MPEERNSLTDPRSNRFAITSSTPLAHSLRRLPHVFYYQPRLSTTLPVLQSRRPVGLVPDASVERGGCRVESSFGEIDAGLDAQLAEISRVLLEPDEVPEACP